MVGKVGGRWVGCVRERVREEGSDPARRLHEDEKAGLAEMEAWTRCLVLASWVEASHAWTGPTC